MQHVREHAPGAANNSGKDIRSVHVSPVNVRPKSTQHVPVDPRSLSGSIQVAESLHDLRLDG